MKKLTLIFSMLIALVGLNANAAIYLVGDGPLGGWSPNGGIEMTNDGTGVYTYDMVVPETGAPSSVYFVFADNRANADDWNTFNGQYRIGPTNGNEDVTSGEWKTTQKAGGDNGAYKFNVTAGETYTFTYDSNQSKFKVEGFVAPVEPTVYEHFTVCGDNTTIFGTTWDPTNTANDMTLDETDGLYKLVKENVEITAGTIYYKVAANHSWDESWGNGSANQNYVFNENGTYDLTFKFNFETKEVSLDAVQTQVGPAIDPYTGHLYMVGNVNDNAWNPANGIAMLTEDEDTFTLANVEIKDAGDGFGYFSFMAVLGTGAESWPADGYRIGAAEDATLATLNEYNNLGGFGTTGAFKVEPGYYNVTVVLSGGENGYLMLTAGQAPQPVVDDVYIIGDVNNIGWSATQGVKMTLNEGLYTAEITTQNQGDLGVAYFGFTKKLAEVDDSTAWDVIAPFRFGPVSEGAFVMTEELLNVNCDLATDGSYNSIAIPAGTWTVTVDLVNNKFAINGTWPTDTVIPEPTTDVYIIGDVNNIGWSATQGVKMTYKEGIYTAEITTQKQGDLELGYFGFTKKLADPESETAWDDIAAFRFGPVSDDAFVMTEELLNVNCDLATDGSYNSIAIPAGTWTVTVDLVNNKFAINGEWPSVEPEHYDGDVYIMGEVNDNGGWFTNKGVKMTRDAENNVYTATITTAGENIPEGEEVGYSYFSFTKQLAEGEADWDAIAPYRFGAVSEGDFLVTEELLGETLALENGGDAYKIPAGEWNLTLSVDKMTLVIEKVASVIRGDVNKDGKVNISDVTSLIDLLLSGGEMIPEGDCNQDGAMNISDVTALIDYLLGGNW